MMPIESVLTVSKPPYMPMISSLLFKKISSPVPEFYDSMRPTSVLSILLKIICFMFAFLLVPWTRFTSEESSISRVLNSDKCSDAAPAKMGEDCPFERVT